jgi:hypothetical protein
MTYHELGCSLRNKNSLNLRVFMEGSLRRTEDIYDSRMLALTQI